MGNDSQEPADIELPDLLDFCRRLNDASVRYIIYDGMACLLHGFERTTKDIDVFVGEEPENIQRALDVLAGWGEGWAAELTVADVIESVVVRICDHFVVDVASKVGKLTWTDAYARRRLIEANGVLLPVLSRQDLIVSKMTYRDRDAIDIRELRALQNPEPGRPADS